MERNEDVMFLAGGRIRCRRCSARSKRTKLRCGAPAMKGKKMTVCNPRCREIPSKIPSKILDSVGV